MVFMQPQRLLVPLFQRPYVWNEENQWEPLWNDLVRVARRLLDEPYATHQPHFMGAVVVQQLQNPLGSMQERTVIDGQQRLTTFQLLLDALHAELDAVGAAQPARRIESLVTNAEAFWEEPADRFKVWPTNRDRAAFNEVMAAPGPVDYDGLHHKGSRLVGAHRYFAERAREWLAADEARVQERAAVLERAAREFMQMVVIDLTAEENAQEIFETLNARGAQLTAADLIKNFIFQRLSEEDVDVEDAYRRFWHDFETGFWEAEISVGRVLHQRSSVFLNHWLIARTGEEILAREVFQRFKTYALYDAGVPMLRLLEEVHRASRVYERFVNAAAPASGSLDRLGLFAYRTGVLESEVVKPLVLFLYDPEQDPIPQHQLTKALDVVESWMVRRMLVRATGKSYTQVFAELITHVGKAGRANVGDLLEDYLRRQTGANWYWPDDREVAETLRAMPVYRRLPRKRLRMVLEAVEDHLRGWGSDATGLGGERVARGQYAIEHILPRSWNDHWPLPADVPPAERDDLVHTLGNLTLLTGRLNSKVSNGPWDQKREALHQHDVLLLNRQLPGPYDAGWNEKQIRARTDATVAAIQQVWATPPGYVSATNTSRRETGRRRVSVADLMAAGELHAGTVLYARRQKVADRTAVVLEDGTLDVDGIRFTTLSAAAVAVSGHSENGWKFWLIDPTTRRSLFDVWQDYVERNEIDDDSAGDD